MSTFPVKYFNYDFVQNLNDPTGSRGQTRNISVFMSDKWYNQAPENDTIIIADTITTDGLITMQECQAEIMAFLGYSPCNVNNKRMLMSQAAVENIWSTPGYQFRPMESYVHGFNGQYDAYYHDQAYVLPNVGGTTMGYNYLGANAGISMRASGSMWGTNSPGSGAGNNITCSAVLCEFTGHGTKDVYFTHKMLFHNEDIAVPVGDKEWELDFTKLAPDNNNPGKYWQCYMNIYMWHESTTNRWFYQIDLEGVSTNMDNAINQLNGKKVFVYDPGDPYHPEPDPPGGNPEADPEGDTIDYPGLPSVDPTQLGAIHLYKLTPTDVANLYNELHANDPGSSIVKWFADPSQSLISLFCMPVPVSTYGTSNISILGFNALSTTGYLIPAWGEWDMGSITLKETQWAGDCFLNRAPHTKISIYLPFCGMHQLDTDEVMGQTLSLKYSFDHVTGACTAFLSVGGGTKSHIRYTFSGSAAMQVPLTQTNWGDTYISMATGAATIAAAGVTGGAAFAAKSALSSAASVGKPTVTRSGSISNSSGFMGVKQPYLVIDCPIQAKPDNMNTVIGFPSGKGVPFRSLSGQYASIEHFHLRNIPATGPEMDEIERLLKQGVIF